MERQSPDSRGDAGEDSTPCTALAPLRGTGHRDDPAAISRPHVPFSTARDLETKLLSFRDYYNDPRTHHALGDVTPSAKSGKMQPKVAHLNDFRWRSHCRGLYHLPVAT